MHLAIDSPFIAFAHKFFDVVFPHQNRFLVISPSGKLTHLKEAPNLTAVSSNYFSNEDFLKDFQDADILIVHCMTGEFANAIQHAPEELFVVWSVWGGDCNDILNWDSLLLPKTLALKNRHRIELRSRLRGWGRKIYRRLRPSPPSIPAVPRKTARVTQISSRIDLISTVTKFEERVIRETLPNLTAPRMHLPYVCTEESFERGPAKMEGPNILVGNSATPTNNHLDAFELLANQDLRGRKIIVPLSYGDNDYRREIVKQGNRLFGESFVPLLEFLPLHVYYETISACGVVLMNHVRQQAMGNILAALYKGARVILRDESPIRHTLRDEGLLLTLFPKCNDPDPDLLAPLDEVSKERNRRIVREVWNQSRTIEEIKEIEFFWNDRKIKKRWQVSLPPS